MGSWEGGSNITLVRPPWRIAGASRSLLLNPLPGRGLRERRRHVLRAAASTQSREVCVGEPAPHRGRSPRRPSGRPARAAETAVDWAGAATPLIARRRLQPATARHAPCSSELEREYGLAAPTSPGRDRPPAGTRPGVDRAARAVAAAAARARGARRAWSTAAAAVRPRSGRGHFLACDSVSRRDGANWLGQRARREASGAPVSDKRRTARRPARDRRTPSRRQGRRRAGPARARRAVAR